MPGRHGSRGTCEPIQLCLGIAERRVDVIFSSCRSSKQGIHVGSVAAVCIYIMVVGITCVHNTLLFGTCKIDSSLFWG